MLLILSPLRAEFSSDQRFCGVAGPVPGILKTTVGLIITDSRVGSSWGGPGGPGGKDAVDCSDRAGANPAREDSFLPFAHWPIVAALHVSPPPMWVHHVIGLFA